MTQDLIKKAQSGDGAAFTALAESLRPRLLSYLYRRLADRGEAEDLCQEALLEAYTALPEIPAERSFQEWVFHWASRLADRITEGAQPWGESALEVLQDYLLTHEAVQGELQEVLDSHDEEFSIEAHVDFCFTVALQGLFPKERNLFLLIEVEGLAPESASWVASVPAGEIDEQRGAASENLRDAFSERCSLVKAGAPCKQCQVFGEWLSGPEETEEALLEFPLRPTIQPETTFSKRLKLIARVDPLRSGSSRFHDHLLQILRRALGEKGLMK